MERIRSFLMHKQMLQKTYDFKLNDEYIAIKPYTGNAETFIEFLRIIKGNSS